MTTPADLTASGAPPDPGATATAGGPGVTDLPRARRIGDYELLDEIARGGMGVVYKARQLSLNRTVALKMILAGTYATPAAVARFRAEAEAAAGLDHPNVLPIYEVGEHAGHQFFSMKLVNGPSLSDWPTESPRMYVRRLVQIVRAVHYAHQRGILHRDLKPSNILLDADGTPYVTDFGLAKKVDADDSSTGTGAVVGTPAYMAPEQARGQKGLTLAADVYGLGAVLHELLTGRPPFKGDTALDTLRQVTDREPDHPQRWNPPADRDLSVIALKCLEKDPARRYPSAAALADDLDRWQSGEPIEARPAGPVERARKWARRNPLAAALAGLGAFAAVAILGLLVVALQQATRATRREADAVKARNDAVEHQQVAEQRLWEATFEQARAERLSGNRWRALELAAEAGRSRVTPELEREAAQAVTAFGLRLVAKTPGRNLVISGVPGLIAFSSDGSQFAVPNHFPTGPVEPRRWVSGVTVHDTATGKIVAEVEGAHDAGGFAFDPTRPALAITRGGRVIVHDLGTRVEADLGPGAGPLAFDPTGKILVASAGPVTFLGRAVTGPRVTAFDLPAGRPQTLSATGRPLAFTPDGLVVRSGRPREGRLHLWDPAADRPIASTPAAFAVVSVSPDGRRAVLTDKGERYQVRDVRAGGIDRAIPRLNRTDYPAAVPLSPTQPLVAYESPTAPRIVELLDLTTGRVRERLLVPGRGKRVLINGQFRPDGSLLTVEDDYNGALTLWEVGTGALLATLPEHSKAQWSPDGRYLVAFCSSGTADLVGGGKAKGTDSHLRIYEVAAVPGRARVSRAADRVSFSADGRDLAAADTVWRVERPGGRPRLTWAGEVRDKDQRTTFFDSAGRRWSFPIEVWLKPDAP